VYLYLGCCFFFVLLMGLLNWVVLFLCFWLKASGSFVFLDIGEAMGFVSLLSWFYALGSLFTCYSHLGY
jgi:hypothetical protein